ncbi:3-hydroxyacyl-CoA dehydrogenase family protein [Sporosarcina pasteurii]|uniref:L-gulonate 3-dehydrogenase n=1 Tax=Sporosarcina pasteurii TaxID=1474 RepID=A0A380BXS5_SPOPA|nr:3-hydroxyacyl-CoA dehydrogenase family protein [Sporosarcina pasteurii]MDS9471416.1 3-hydroxyacyl-CoA dehydrogenase family protein [Sporosarcina pasteurii]QBQ04958.1 3-hydroxyacyl-CoA dehydrogenase family protein [Sporosarcina pasteurii]SUJ09058.1 3-hydroxybutyryl-CoA dehydrogenase [Sporosarcina pasteurii]
MENITVLGAGVMGHGAAQLFAQAGKNVRIQARRETSLEKAKDMITNSLKIMVEKAMLTENDMNQALARITYKTDLHEAIQDADFILESIPEVLQTKLDTYEIIESAVSKNTIISSNTSTFPLKELTKNAKHPERFIITHFFNPPQIVPIVEIVKVEDTDEAVVETTYDLMKGIGKSPVVLKKEITGFIVNRVQVAMLREAFHLIESGVATAEDIDVAMKGSMGFKWAFCGPMESQDLAGLQTTEAMVGNIMQDLSNTREVPSFLSDMVEHNQHGIRTNQGFYQYDDYGEQAIHTRDDHFLDLLKLMQQKADANKEPVLSSKN